MNILQKLRRPPYTRIVNVMMAIALLIGIIPFMPKAHADATPTFVQGRSNEITTGTVNNLAFTNTNATGNLSVVYVLWGNTSAVTITDSAGNAYAAAGPRTSWGTGNGWSSQTFYAKNIAAGANTVTATFSANISSTSSKFGIIYIHEYAGIDKTNPLDVAITATGTTSAMSSGTITTTNANDLIFGGGGSKNTVTAAGSGFTNRMNTYGNRTEDRTVTTTGSYAATATQNSNLWVMDMVAFRADPGSSDTTAPSVPTGLAAAAAGASQVNLSWTPSTDNVAVTGYRIYRNGTQIGTSTTASYADTSVSPTTSYNYTVSAYDAANNNSAQSAAANVTTPAIPNDDTLSVHIDTPTAGAQVNNIVNITADAGSDLGVAGVQFYVDGAVKGPEDTTAPYVYVWDTRTVNNGAHTLTARVRNNSGNSKLSDPVAVNVANLSYFQNEILATGFDLPTTMEFLPDGRMLVAELQGRIKVVDPPYTQATPGLFLQISNVGSSGVYQGIYDIALDPDFTTNHYYYVFYTMGSPRHDRVSRFTANTNVTGTIAGSEFVLYEDPQDANSEHHGGAMAFDNNGKFFFTTGEHFDANAAPKLTSPRGKLHRINKDGTVPTDNPFYDGAGPNVDSIWAIGLRNPFRMSYDAPTDKLYIGDVGGNNNATSMEEVNVGARGANYGWPATEGYTTNPTYTSPIYAYPHAGRDASVTGGFVYRGSQFPASYQGNYFVADYAQNWIRGLNLDASGAVSNVYNFEPADGSLDGPYGDIVSLAQGPDGSLFYVDLGFDDASGTAGVSKIRRIRYNQTNQAPVAISTATPDSGQAPLTVNFSSAGSVDPEGVALTYNWTFGDNTTSTEANPTHTYNTPGQYTARLSVSDGVTTTLSTPLTIAVGNKPVATITSPSSGSLFQAGQVINFSGTATDLEDGTLPESAYKWKIEFAHGIPGGHFHPHSEQTGGSAGSFTIPMDGHDFSGSTGYRITLTVTDSNGLTSSQELYIYPQKVNISFNSEPSGRTIYLDGLPHVTPFVYDTLVGFKHTVEMRDQIADGNNYTFGSWSDGGAATHLFTVPSTDQTLTATFNATPLPTGLVGAWGFNEGAGTTSGDSSGNNNVGTMTGGGVTWNPAGHTGSALSFDGTAGYLNIPNSTSLGLTSSHTLEAWIKPTSLTGYQSIFTKEIPGAGCSSLAYWFQLNGNRLAAGFNNGSSCIEHLTTNQPTLTVGTWNHVAAVFDDAANTYKIYLNGTLVTTQTENGAPSVKNSPLMIGQSGYNGGANERWHGLLDDIRIYNRALTAAEITGDMNTGL